MLLQSTWTLILQRSFPDVGVAPTRLGRLANAQIFALMDLVFKKEEGEKREANKKKLAKLQFNLKYCFPPLFSLFANDDYVTDILIFVDEMNGGARMIQCSDHSYCCLQDKNCSCERGTGTISFEAAPITFTIIGVPPIETTSK